MGHAGFNIFDIVVFGAMALSGYFAYKRGLVKEILSLGSWVLAAVITVTCYPLIKPILALHLRNEMAVDAASAITLFCITIVILVPIGNYLTGLVKGPNMTSIDKALGFGFGVLRGFLILSLLYWCSTFIWPSDTSGKQMQPVWLVDAKTKPLLEGGVSLIRAVIPFDNKEALDQRIKEGQDSAKETIDNADERLEKMSVPVPASKGSTSSSPSYDQDSLKDLIDRKVSP